MTIDEHNVGGLGYQYEETHSYWYRLIYKS